MSHQFQRSVASYAMSPAKLLESRLDEFTKEHGNIPLAIHMTGGMAVALAADVFPEHVKRTLPDGYRLAVGGGAWEGVPVLRCTDTNCTIGDAFLFGDRQSELI